MSFRNNFLYSLFSLGCVAVSDAPAANFLTGNSAQTTALAGAFVPGTDTVQDAMSINPAALALIGSPLLELSVAGIFARGSFQSGGAPPAPLTSYGVVPYGAFSTPVGKSRFTVALALAPQLTSSANWRYTDPSGGVGKVSYGTLDHQSEIVALRGSFGVGISLTRRLQVGFTTGVVYNRNTLRTAYIFQEHPTLAGLKTLLDLRTSGTGWNSSLGVLFQASRKWQIGGAYQSQTTLNSRGTATGNAGLQFAAIGLGAARPDFGYRSLVKTKLPQSAIVHTSFELNHRTRAVMQLDWIDWRNAFRDLPVALTQGNNSDINSLLNSTSINDSVPLRWKNQVAARFGIERGWQEHATLRAGFAHSSSIVPAQTLTPLTAALTRNTAAAGIGYRLRRCRFNLGYNFDPTVRKSIGRSILKSGEYSNSQVRTGTQAIVFSTSFQL